MANVTRGAGSAYPASWIVHFRAATGFHHRFRVRDEDGVLELRSHLELHVLELDHWRHNPDLSTPAGLLGWMRFFTEAETWRQVPRDIDTPVLESAMSVLTDFQTNSARNDLSRSRLDYLRVQNTMAAELAQALADKEQALAKEAQALGREAKLRERRKHSAGPGACRVADHRAAPRGGTTG